MDVIICAELPSVIVTPRVQIIFIIDDCDITCAQIHVLDRIFKSGFHSGTVDARLEEWSVALYSSHETRNFLKLLNESISRSRT